MKITCDEATTICDKTQYKEATLWEKIKLNIHLLYCKHCGIYSKQNAVMTKCYEKYINSNTNENQILGEEEKAYMEQKIKENCSL